jgi:26S proteasome regulatory subunit T2
MEEEVVAIYQARQREKELKDGTKAATGGNRENEDENLLATLKGSPLGVGTLEEVMSSHFELMQIIDDDHAIVSSTSGPEYYVPIMSFVDKELLEPGCSVLLHQKVALQEKELTTECRHRRSVIR